MASKRKKLQVPKVQITPQSKPTSAEALINYNAELVESLFSSQAWVEIVFPLLQESIASVSGRYSNGRFWQGALTKNDRSLEELKGYQLALEEFHNRLHDFILAKNKLQQQKKNELLNKESNLYNPFMEEHGEQEQSD